MNSKGRELCIFCVSVMVFLRIVLPNNAKKCIICRGKFVHTFYLVCFGLFDLFVLLCIIGEKVHYSA